MPMAESRAVVTYVSRSKKDLRTSTISRRSALVSRPANGFTITTALGLAPAIIPATLSLPAGELVGSYTTIDTRMHGFDHVTAAYVVAGEKVALVETGPKSKVENVFAGLDALGIDRLDWIIVTHIHLDHAGAAGTIAQRFPEARLAVHGVGAPHLADPSKLWSSASRIYGDRMEEMWGGIDPLDAGRITVLEDGDEIELGGRVLRAIETPGHAYHHHAFLDSDSGCVFTGDALGVRLPGVPVVRPATPPPEFHLEKAIASIERLRGLGASELVPTHFGPVEGDVDAT